MRPLGFPNWEELYRSDTVEALPWYWPSIDPDLEAVLARQGVAGGRALDQGTGPGTQAIALAGRGFTVTATDVSDAALAPQDIRGLFADGKRFELVEIFETVYQGQLDPYPKALFSALRRI
jgi:methylase of polypeptide subunit release factors